MLVSSGGVPAPPPPPPILAVHVDDRSHVQSAPGFPNMYVSHDPIGWSAPQSDSATGSTLPPGPTVSQFWLATSPVHMGDPPPPEPPEAAVCSRFFGSWQVPPVFEKHRRLYAQPPCGDPPPPMAVRVLFAGVWIVVGCPLFEMGVGNTAAEHSCSTCDVATPPAPMVIV